MRDLVKIADTIKKLIAIELAPVEILDVKVQTAFDREGDEYLRVNVLYDGVPRDLDFKKTSGMIRLLRPKLLELMGETAFPVISYISSSDLGDRHFAAA